MVNADKRIADVVQRLQATKSHLSPTFTTIILANKHAEKTMPHISKEDLAVIHGLQLNTLVDSIIFMLAQPEQLTTLH